MVLRTLAVVEAVALVETQAVQQVEVLVPTGQVHLLEVDLVLQPQTLRALIAVAEVPVVTAVDAVETTVEELLVA
jgi:hypothetical protein